MAKRVPALSSAKFKALKPAEHTIELVDGAVPGLRVRMTPHGVMTWSLNIRDAKGARRRFDIGQGLGLAAAREEAVRIRQRVRGGADPTEDKRAARRRADAARRGIGTLGSVIAEYYESGPGKLLSTRGEQERRIKHVFARHLDRPASDISAAELQLTVDKHASASSAGHAVAYFRPLAAWASKRELIRKGFDDLEKPVEQTDPEAGAGQRVLSDKDLGKILPKLGRRGHDAAARFMLWTACRLDEACSATWSEVNLEGGTWTIPAARRKDTRSRTRKKQVKQIDHAIILPPRAIELLSEIGPNEPHALVFQGHRGSRLQNWDRWQKAIAHQTGVSGWDRHALRRTTATMAGQLGAPPHVISALLGHRNIGDQLTAVYSKARYTLEVGEVLVKVADRLDQIQSEQPIEGSLAG